MLLIHKDTLDALEESLKNSTGPDHDLDLRIAKAFERPLGNVSKYTGSIDAAFLLGRSVPGLNIVKLHKLASDGITETGGAFIPVFARNFCLAVVRAVRDRQDALPIKEKS